MKLELTTEDIRALADIERKMDSGEVAFVVFQGERLSVIPEVADELGLKQGQTISLAIFIAMTHANIRHCQREIELRKNPQ
jgi:hypothetical protein